VRPFFSSFFQETTEEDIREFFSPFGEIKRINLVMDRETNRSKGFCFVVFSTEISANLALENKTALIKGKRVDIKKAVQSSVKPTIPYVFPQLGFNHK
jgi:RNA recognition motif-containing protein